MQIIKLKKLFLKILLIPNIEASIKKFNAKREYRNWKTDGCPIPAPQIVKQRIIKNYQINYGITTLIETGTYLGDMVEAQKKVFKKIISIELGTKLFEDSKFRFKDDKHITIVQGDSGKMLPNILKDVHEPVIFWLDGHYSEGVTAKGDKDCPILEELSAIFNSSQINYILLIDDARCFDGKGDYPSIEYLKEFININNPENQIEIKHDIIRCVIGK